MDLQSTPLSHSGNYAYVPISRLFTQPLESLSKHRLLYDCCRSEGSNPVSSSLPYLEPISTTTTKHHYNTLLAVGELNL